VVAALLGSWVTVAVFAVFDCEAARLLESSVFGYDVRDHRLVVNQEESRLVRHIYECYLELAASVS
jgi:hypothetical protein